MTARNAAELAFGVAGIYFLAEHAPAAVLLFVTAPHETPEMKWFHWTNGAGVVLMFLCGGALLVFRKGLAARLTRGMDVPGGHTEAPGIHAAAVSVLGIYFFVGGVSPLVSLAALHLSQPTLASANFTDTAFIQSGIQTVLGAGLFLGAHGVVRAWTALRTAGRHDSDDA